LAARGYGMIGEVPTILAISNKCVLEGDRACCSDKCSGSLGLPVWAARTSQVKFRRTQFHCT
jgi:hypothetical protein